MVRRTHLECLLAILLTEVVNNTKDFGNFVFGNPHKQVFNYRVVIKILFLESSYSEM